MFEFICDAMGIEYDSAEKLLEENKKLREQHRQLMMDQAKLVIIIGDLEDENEELREQLGKA